LGAELVAAPLAGVLGSLGSEVAIDAFGLKA